MSFWEDEDSTDYTEVEKVADLKLAELKEKGKTRYTITEHDVQMLKDCGIEPFMLAPHVKRL